MILNKVLTAQQENILRYIKVNKHGKNIISNSGKGKLLSMVERIRLVNSVIVGLLSFSF